MSQLIALHPGLSLMGYFLSEIGLGQAVRNLAYSCEAHQLPVSYLNVYLQDRCNDLEFLVKCHQYQGRVANFHVTGITAVECFDFEAFSGRKNYLYPFWELMRVPEHYTENLMSFDDIFAPSSFIADMLGKTLNRPIEVIPMPVNIPETINDSLGASGKIRILSFFDMDSSPARKNPWGAIHAFSLAFPSDNSVELIIKTRGRENIEAREALQRYADRDSRITVIDQTFSRSEMDKLIYSCDIYIAMHRSEGFGLGPAEAMAAGKIVVATDYSGTTDFVNYTTGYPVTYDLVPVKKNEYIHWEDQVWAEPSIEHAAQHLRDIYDNFDAAKARAKNGRQWIKKNHSAYAVGEILKKMMITRGLIF